MASGRAVVATNVGGIADIIDNGKTGIYCETKVEVFAASLAKLIENPSLRNQMGIKASNAVIHQFTYKRLVTDVDQLYKKYLN